MSPLSCALHLLNLPTGLPMFLPRGFMGTLSVGLITPLELATCCWIGLKDPL